MLLGPRQRRIGDGLNLRDADRPGHRLNTATVSAARTDPVSANNTAVATTTVNAGPSTFLVINTNDSGSGSLRQAIANANATAGQDLIAFAIPGTGVRTITPQSPLPAVTDTVYIDGLTQPGFTSSPLIELDGTSAGPTANGLVLGGANITVRGLVINRFGTGGTPTDASRWNSCGRAQTSAL